MQQKSVTAMPLSLMHFLTYIWRTLIYTVCIVLSAEFFKSELQFKKDRLICLVCFPARSCWHAARRGRAKSKKVWTWCSACPRELTMLCMLACWKVAIWYFFLFAFKSGPTARWVVTGFSLPHAAIFAWPAFIVNLLNLGTIIVKRCFYLMSADMLSPLAGFRSGGGSGGAGWAPAPGFLPSVGA